MTGGPILKECEGCTRIADEYCSVWVNPSARFRVGHGDCGMSTHIKNIKRVIDEKVRVGQQKQKKKKKTRG